MRSFLLRFAPRAWPWRMGVVGALLCSVAALVASAAELPPATGAAVDETRLRQTLYVDPASAEAVDDEQHGTAADAPFATLRYACQAAGRLKDAGQGVKVLLAPGTYRETATIHPPAGGKPDTEAPLVIEAAERDQTVLDGADTDGWTPSTWKEEEDGRWSHPWPFLPVSPKLPAEVAAALRSLPPPAAAVAYRHGALLFVNNVALRQVNDAASLQPGTFWLRGAVPVAAPRRGASPSPEAAGSNGPLVIVQPSEDTPLRAAIIQVGVRPEGLVVSGRRNVVVRGLSVQHSAAPLSSLPGSDGAVGVRFDDCTNVLVEDVLSQWNDGNGMVITGHAAPAGAGYTLRRVRVLHNGGTGLAIEGVQNLLSEDGETSFNNFRGEWTNWIDPQRVAGLHAVRVNGSTWRRQRVVGNAGRGLWFVGGTDLTVEEAVVRDNVASGVLFDACPGPTLLRRGLVTGTRLLPGLRNTSAEAAVSVNASPDVTLESNVLAVNAVAALGVADLSPGSAPPAPARGRAAADHPGLRSERHTLRHNIVYARDAQILSEWPAADHLGAVDFTSYFLTLALEDNCFWNPDSPEAFEVYELRGPRRPALNFADWLAFLAARAGGEGRTPPLRSVWQDPGFVDPAEGDFRLLEGGPAQGWGTPGEERAAGQEQ